jgi:hypothetical protein
MKSGTPVFKSASLMIVISLFDGSYRFGVMITPEIGVVPRTVSFTVGKS